ncbi:MAG TPA: MBL fold metallo-hydrolase [Acidimicrobiales bacterium]|nr:MBL fold metallo-hydrolase [Acidimicrobiales bacterium]
MADEPLYYQDPQVDITRVVVGPMDNNVYVVRCRRTGESVLIDAADEGDLLVDLCRSLNVTKVLTTHGHQDHIQAIPAVRAAGIGVGIGADDVGMLTGLGGPTSGEAVHDFVIDDGSVFRVGELTLRTIHTPGHTPGSMCFVVEGSPVLLSGDTLFPGGPGATKFPGGDFSTIIASIGERLYAGLPDDTVVMPGHGDSTTIGAERPHLQEWTDRGW